MVLKAEKERIKTLISDTVTLLCKNGLNYKAQFSIEAVIGISLDESEEFYLSIKENVKQAQVVEKPNREPAEQSARRSPNRSPVLTPTKKRKHGLLANIKKEVHIKSTPPANFSNSRQANGSHVDQSTSDVIPNLSLGDIQENASEYWSSMTPGGGNDDNQEGGQEESVSVEGSQPPAKRQNRDSSNTSGDANQTDLQQQGDDDSMSHQADVISIKDEPDSDYDESDLQLQEHGGQLSLEGSTLQPVSTPSWMAGLPHSALQTSQGDPQQMPAQYDYNLTQYVKRRVVLHPGIFVQWQNVCKFMSKKHRAQGRKIVPAIMGDLTAAGYGHGFIAGNGRYRCFVKNYPLDQDMLGLLGIRERQYLDACSREDTLLAPCSKAAFMSEFPEYEALAARLAAHSIARDQADQVFRRKAEDGKQQIHGDLPVGALHQAAGLKPVDRVIYPSLEANSGFE